MFDLVGVHKLSVWSVQLMMCLYACGYCILFSEASPAHYRPGSSQCKCLIHQVVSTCAHVQSDKVQFLRHINDLPSKEVRTAEMILFSGQQQDAEGLLIQAGLVFRAIMLNLDLFNWDRYAVPHLQSTVLK